MRHRSPGKGSRSVAVYGGPTAPGPAPGKRTRTAARYGSTVQRKTDKNSQRAAGGAGTASNQSEGAGESAHGGDAEELTDIAAAGEAGGHGLAPDVRAEMESSFGADFSAVTIHQDGLAESVGAEAYAQGTAIHFAPGRYDPSSAEGLELLGHELAHVVQQGQGRVAQGAEVGGLSVNDDAGLEQEADRLGAAAARGEQSGAASGMSLNPGAQTVQRRTRVNPVASVARHDGPALIGDGSPAHPGLTVRQLNSYATRQADWFTEPTLTAADRDLVWKVVMLLREGSHMLAALGALRAGELARMSAGDLSTVRKYATCFDSSAQTIQVSTAAATLARALQLGHAIVLLEFFVPAPVMRVVIPESGLTYLVDNGKIPDLWTYYLLFQPTLETQQEWEYIEDLLDEGVTTYVALIGWVRDLHIFTKATRKKLLANVVDTSRSKPVMLILFSATDWNTAFMQAENMEDAILEPHNLALVIQGASSIAEATASVDRIADNYGQTTSSWDWDTWSMVESPARLGQVVIAGHGSDQSVEMASTGANPYADGDNRSVGYDEESIDSSDPAANGTQLLIDTVLSRMDPADANVVFAGCLVGSHNIPAGTDVSGTAAEAQANLQTALAAQPNLADYVRGRMTAAGITGTVQAANASTTFDSFKVDGSGRAELSNTDDPDVSGSKLQYLRTGIEPEGALRAALECYANAAIGPATTTAEMRTRVVGLAGNTGWWETITRTGLELSLPGAPSLVDIAKLLDLSHRVAAWFSGGWAEMINVQSMANTVKAAEAATVFPAMLGSSWAIGDHLAVGVPLAWLKHDAAQAGPFMVALTASSLDREGFRPLAARGILDPKLATLLPLGGAPTNGKMILALTIAAGDRASMPEHVREFLRAAAGGATTTAFPVALGVGSIISASTEADVLDDIGLSPSSGPPAGGGGASTVDGNVDTRDDGSNDTYVTVSSYEATVTAGRLNVRDRATTRSRVIDTVSRGDTVRVMGRTPNRWALIDHDGTRGFVHTRYIT